VVFSGRGFADKADTHFHEGNCEAAIEDYSKALEFGERIGCYLGGRFAFREGDGKMKLYKIIRKSFTIIRVTKCWHEPK